MQPEILIVDLPHSPWEVQNSFSRLIYILICGVQHPERSGHFLLVSAERMIG